MRLGRGHDGRDQVDGQPGHAAAADLPDRVRDLLVADAAEAQQVLGAFLLHHLDGVVDGDDADQPPVRVDNRCRDEVVLVEGVGDVFLRVEHADGAEILVHQ